MKKFIPMVFSAAFLMFAASIPFQSCSQQDVGVPCDIPGVVAGNDTDTTINTQALDCNSRLCMFYASSKSRSMCTQICDSTDDCPGPSETCKNGFVCFHGLQVGGLKCCKMCVCKDFVSNPDKDPLASSCQNVAAVCPKL